MDIHSLKDEILGKALAATVDALAKDNFYREFARCCELVSGFESTLVVWLSKMHRPLYLYDDLSEEVAASSTKPWLEGAYLLDPFYALFEGDKHEGVYRLDDIAPDNFYSSYYYKTYYVETGLTDEVGLLIRLDCDHSVLVSLGNRGRSRAAAGQLQELRSLMPVLSALCRKQQSASDGEITFSGPLDKAFRNFGKDHLSGRECEVIQLILKGHSNKSIAELLDISIETVKVYNKRFHQKLQISSQAELFSLFLESISLVPFDADIDPLTHYLEITDRR